MFEDNQLITFHINKQDSVVASRPVTPKGTAPHNGVLHQEVKDECSNSELNEVEEECKVRSDKKSKFKCKVRKNLLPSQDRTGWESP